MLGLATGKSHFCITGNCGESTSPFAAFGYGLTCDRRVAGERRRFFAPETVLGIRDREYCSDDFRPYYRVSGAFLWNAFQKPFIFKNKKK